MRHVWIITLGILEYNNYYYSFKKKRDNNLMVYNILFPKSNKILYYNVLIAFLLWEFFYKASKIFNVPTSYCFCLNSERLVSFLPSLDFRHFLYTGRNRHISLSPLGRPSQFSPAITVGSLWCRQSLGLNAFFDSFNVCWFSVRWRTLSLIYRILGWMSAGADMLGRQPQKFALFLRRCSPMGSTLMG